MADHIDCDAGDSIMRKRGCYGKRRTLLAVSKSMPKNRHRPAIRWARSRWDKQVEEDVLRALCRNALGGGHLWDEHVGVLPVRTTELSEGQRANGTRENLQSCQRAIQVGGNQRANCQCLHVPGKPCDRIGWKYCLLSAASPV